LDGLCSPNLEIGPEPIRGPTYSDCLSRAPIFSGLPTTAALRAKRLARVGQARKKFGSHYVLRSTQDYDKAFIHVPKIRKMRSAGPNFATTGPSGPPGSPSKASGCALQERIRSPYGGIIAEQWPGVGRTRNGYGSPDPGMRYGNLHALMARPPSSGPTSSSSTSRAPTGGIANSTAARSGEHAILRKVRAVLTHGWGWMC
jgi:hypothetical protein